MELELRQRARELELQLSELHIQLSAEREVLGYAGGVAGM